MASQKNKLLNLLNDEYPHRTDEILKVVYGSEHLGLARIAARIWDLKQEGFNIRSWSDENNPTLTWYQLTKLNFNGVPIEDAKENKLSSK